jgi:fanconi-associated nuclease 1
VCWYLDADVGVSWDQFSIDDIVEIAECIGPKLAGICRLFSKSYWSHSGGLPDLCVWKLESKEFKLVEVKSKNDKLSEGQIVWIANLMSFGIEAETLHIREVK